MLLIAKQQAVTDGKGGHISTPSITVYEFENGTTVKAGKFYLKQSNDVYIGVQVQTGGNAPAILYPVDRSRIPSGYTLTYVPKGTNNDE